jgi:hypothetical protein
MTKDSVHKLLSEAAQRVLETMFSSALARSDPPQLSRNDPAVCREGQEESSVRCSFVRQGFRLLFVY